MILVVAVVAGAAATAVTTGGGTAVAAAVQRQMARALCVVGRGNCDVDRLPCVTEQQRSVTSGALTVAIIRLGHDRTILRETRSDQTVAITLVDRGKFGFTAGFGVRGKLQLAGLNLSLGGEFSAAAVALFGAGQTWVVKGKRAADALVERVRHQLPSRLQPRRLRRDGRPVGQADLPPADQVFSDRGLSVSGRVALTAASLTLEAEDVFGTRTDTHTGQVTAYVRRRNGIVGALGTYQRSGDRSEQYAVTYARDGRPLDLAVLTSGTTTASRGLAFTSPTATASGSAKVHRGDGSMWATEVHLDLTDADNLAAATAFLGQVRSPQPHVGALVKVSQALRQRLEERGVVHTRELEVDQDGFAVGARASVGVQAGFDYERSTQTARVIDAATRGIDGVWRDRPDCLARTNDNTKG